MADSPPDTRQRRRRRAQPDAAPAAVLAPVGGRLALLGEDELDLIHDAALAILADTGLADPTDEAAGLVLGAGGSLSPAPRTCLLYTSPSPRDQRGSRMPSSA